MPLDPSIPLGARVAQFDSPLVALTQIAQLQGVRDAAEARRLAGEEARRRAARQQQIEDVYTRAITVNPATKQPRIDYDVLLGASGLPGDLRPAVVQQMEEDRKLAIELQTADWTREEKRTALLGSAARTVLAAKGNPLIWGVELLALKRLGAIDDDQHNQFARLQDPQQILTLAEGYAAKAGGAAEKPGMMNVPVGGVVFDPVTRQPVFTNARPAATEGFTLSPGATRFGPGGEVVASVPPTPAAAGGTDTFTLSPGQTRYGPGGQVIASRPAAAGEAPGAVKLTAAQQEDIATMLTVQDLSAAALTLGDQIKWRGTGPVAGRVGSAGARWFGAGGEDAERLRNTIGNIQGTIAKLRGGTAFSAQEKAILDSYTPTIADSPLQIKAKLQSLDEFITAKRENTLRVASGDYTRRPASAAASPPADGAPKTDPLGIR